MDEVQARVEDLSHDGLGVIKVNDKVYFVGGVLPDELISFKPGKKRKGKFEGNAVEILEPSSQRVEAECEYFGICGGCALQHLESKSQIEYKEKILIDNLTRIGKVTSGEVLAPLKGDLWNYRRKARLGVKYVPKKGGIIVGFREKQSSFITSLQHCRTLDLRISDLLPSLHELITGLSNNTRIPQIEVAAGDHRVAMVLRHLESIFQSDIERLKEYAAINNVDFFTQSKGPDSVMPVGPGVPVPLRYRHDLFGIELEFNPLDFIQVNASVNQLMVKQAYDFLNPVASDRILDLFCGLGNFTLPLATSGADVIGVEGDSYLVNKGRSNAQINQIENASFEKLDLHAGDLSVLTGSGKFNKMLIDPPRSGAFQVVQEVVPMLQPERLVYVSCNPATLARDADVMVNHNGYTLTYAGAIDMFPHTAHVESMAVFDRS